MYILAIAGFGNPENTYKLRLIDIDTMVVRDEPVKNIRAALEQGLIDIKNVEIKEVKINGLKNIKSREIKGINGSLDKIPYLDTTGSTYKRTSYTILYRIENQLGYIICDHTGKPYCVTESELCGLNLGYGIINANIFRESGKILILPLIEGFKTFKVDSETRQELSNKTQHVDILNAKLGVVQYPYRVLGDTIEIVRKDFTELNISTPIKFLYTKVFDGCEALKELTLPNTIEELNTAMLGRYNGFRRVNLSRKTVLSDFQHNKAFYKQIVNYYD